MLEEALLDFGGAILTISHDRYYLDHICTRTLELDAGVVRDYPGGYIVLHQLTGPRQRADSALPPTKATRR